MWKKVGKYEYEVDKYRKAENKYETGSWDKSLTESKRVINTESSKARNLSAPKTIKLYRN